MLGDGLLGTGDESPVIADRSLIHVAKIAPELLLGSGVAKLDLSLLLDDHLRDASVNGGKQLGLILGSDPVPERGEPMMELLPEFDAVIDRPPLRDGAEIDDLDLARESLAFSRRKNPYRNPVVQGSREKPPRENTGQRVLGSGSAEVCCESPAKRGDFISPRRTGEG
jgi:hypothetical protein